MKGLFAQQLDRVRANIIRMGETVNRQIDYATIALTESSAYLKRTIHDHDRTVDNYDEIIDRQVELIFAMTRPAAAELRLLMSALKVNNELERIGNRINDIAERMPSLHHHANLIRRIGLIRMAAMAQQMVKDAIKSFAGNDPELAHTVRRDIDTIDESGRKILQHLVEGMKTDPTTIEPASHAIVLVRHLERVADHAANIAEDVIFLNGGEIVARTGADRMSLSSAFPRAGDAEAFQFIPQRLFSHS